MFIRALEGQRGGLGTYFFTRGRGRRERGGRGRREREGGEREGEGEGKKSRYNSKFPVYADSKLC